MAMEHTGEAIKYLSVDDRLTLCHMAIEAGGKNGIVEADEVTMDYVTKRSTKKPVVYKSDPDAKYIRTVEVDVSKLEPFFFSSRRRHTRWNCDWSSDVCSSDLLRPGVRARGSDDQAVAAGGDLRDGRVPNHRRVGVRRLAGEVVDLVAVEAVRSEERRVGKECRYRWARYREVENRKWMWGGEAE